MLSHSKLESIILTSRIDEAEAFYRDVLGLSLRARSDGARVAWFRDPDGNLLSVVQFPTANY